MGELRAFPDFRPKPPEAPKVRLSHIEKRVLYVLKQVEQGHPLSDFMDEDDILEALRVLAKSIPYFKESQKELEEVCQ